MSVDSTREEEPVARRDRGGHRDLSGWTVVVTRAEGEDGPLGRTLAARGARVLRAPTVQIGPPEDAASLDAALARLDVYDWIVFTSPRAVDAVTERSPPGPIAALPDRIGVAVVGPSTADRASAAGLPATVVGSGEGAAALARELVARGVGAGATVLFPASSRAGADLTRILRDAGAEVERVTAYETRVAPFDPGERMELRGADVVTFTSPSAVEGWCASFADGFDGPLSTSVRYVAIGSTTEEAAAALGLAAIRAPEASFDGVVAAVAALVAPGSPGPGGSSNE